MYIFLRILIVHGTNEILKSAKSRIIVNSKTTVVRDDSNLQSKKDATNTIKIDHISQKKTARCIDLNEKTENLPSLNSNHECKKSNSHDVSSKTREEKKGYKRHRKDAKGDSLIIEETRSKKLKSVVYVENIPSRHENRKRDRQPIRSYTKHTNRLPIPLKKPLLSKSVIQENELKNARQKIERLIQKNHWVRNFYKKAPIREYIIYLAKILEISDDSSQKFNSTMSSINKESKIYKKPEKHLEAIMNWIEDIFKSTKLLKNTSLVEEILQSLKISKNTEDFLKRLNYLLIELDNLLKSKELINDPQICSDKNNCRLKLKEIFEKEFQKKIYCIFPELEIIFNSFFRDLAYSIKLNLKCILPTLCLIIFNNIGCEISNENETSYKILFLASQASFPFILLYNLIIRDLFFSLDFINFIPYKDQIILDKYMENFIFIFSHGSGGVILLQANSVFEVCFSIYSNMFCLHESSTSTDSKIRYLNLLNSINEWVDTYKRDKKVNIQRLYDGVAQIVEKNIDFFKNLMQKRIYFYGFKSDDSNYRDIIIWAYSVNKEPLDYAIIYKKVDSFNNFCRIYQRKLHEPKLNYYAISLANSFIQNYGSIQ